MVMDNEYVTVGGSLRCAGCGYVCGTATIAVGPSDLVTEPTWPFPEGNCPLCRYRAIHNPPDKLEQRMGLRAELDKTKAKLRIAVDELNRISAEGHDESRLYLVRKSLEELPES